MFRIVFLVISSALLHISFLRAFICVFAIAFVSYPCFDYLVVTPNVTILLNAHRSNLECDDDYSQAIYQYLVRMIADVFGLLSMLQFVFFSLGRFLTLFHLLLMLNTHVCLLFSYTDYYIKKLDRRFENIKKQTATYYFYK